MLAEKGVGGTALVRVNVMKGVVWVPGVKVFYALPSPRGWESSSQQVACETDMKCCWVKKDSMLLCGCCRRVFGRG